MKRLLFLILFFPIVSFGQSGSVYNYWVSQWRSYNNTNVTSKTSAHSITPTNVGAGIGDSLAKYLMLLNDSLQAEITSSGSICAAITAGNYCGSGIPIILGNGTDSVVYSANQVVGYVSGSPKQTFGISTSGYGGELTLRDASTGSYSFTLLGVGLTANENLYAPVLNTSGYSNNALITTTTPLTINSTNGSSSSKITPTGIGTFSNGTNSVQVQPLAVTLYDGSNAIGGIAVDGDGSQLFLVDDLGSGYYGSITVDNITNDWNYFTPNHNGTLATNNNGTDTVTSLVGATSTTVYHSLGWTPKNIIITPQVAGLAGFYVTAIGSTTFTLNFPSFTGTLIFKWQAF